MALNSGHHSGIGTFPLIVSRRCFASAALARLFTVPLEAFDQVGNCEHLGEWRVARHTLSFVLYLVSLIAFHRRMGFDTSSGVFMLKKQY